LQKLCENPGIIKDATDELLRFDAPVHSIRRKALVDVALGGETIRAGDKVLLMLLAANHDPEVFENPDTLDLGRRDNWHIAFGSGIHTCAGGILARAETEIAVGAIVSRLPTMKIAGEAQWGGSFIIRSLRQLPVRLG
jgi:cytochrome P450